MISLEGQNKDGRGCVKASKIVHVWAWIVHDISPPAVTN